MSYQVWIHARQPLTLSIIGSVLIATFADRLEAEAYNEKLNLREFGPTAFGPWVLCRSSLFQSETRGVGAPSPGSTCGACGQWARP